MLKIIGVIAVTLLVLVLLVVAYASTRPDSFRVERRARIAAAPDKVYPLISDLKGFNRWNPWARKDPKMTSQYSGPAGAQVGAKYAWQSREVGEGSMELTELQAMSRVRYKLEFIKPFAAVHQVEFTLTPDAQGGTEVVWAMDGPSPLVSKVMGLFMNMDRMIGDDFEQGLANLQQVATQP
jgi:uncharacterized protein YndB with AHSA1/START domain